MNNLAPIVLFTYNRLWHTQQTIESLQKNELANESELIIFSDGAKKDTDIQKILELRTYLKTIDGFKTVKIIERNENFGLANSIVTGVTEVINIYGKIIVLEDDLLTSQYFLLYMNNALIVYENTKQVASINGYFLNVNKKLPETFFLNFADCLGWATWKRAWDLYEPSSELLYNEIVKNNLSFKFNFENGYPYTDMLNDQAKGKNTSWAIKWYASTFIKNKLSLCVNQSLVYHNGKDGSGTNFGNSDLLDVIINQNPVNLKPIQIKEKKNARKEMIKFFHNSNNEKPTTNSKLKYFIKLFIPPIILKIRNRIKRKFTKENINIDIKPEVEIKQKYGWLGNYSTWAEAKSNCTGYDSDIIIEKVRNSLLKVKNGEAVYERDSVLFDKIEYSYPLISGLMWIAAQNNGELNIIDFGGSLGSTYFQNRLFLKDLKKVNWNIVEQQKFVEIGKKKFETDILKFYNTIVECLSFQKSNTILLSSVIQYLEEPYEFIDKLLTYNFEFIIFDRTAFIESEDRITVQNVPETIYKASYPAWFYNKEKFISKFGNKYDLIIEFDSGYTSPILIDNTKAYWSGFILRKNEK